MGWGVVAAAELAGVVWWVALGAAALLLVVAGLLGSASRPALSAETLALLGFGGAAVITLFVQPRAGLVLAGAVLASHAVWDLLHLRGRQRLVPRSLSEFCILLDVPAGVGFVVLAAVS